MRKLLKSMAGRLYCASGRVRSSIRQHATIVAFHRIDDRYPNDPITYSESGFRAFCRFFRRYFDVVSLSDLLDALAQNASIGGKLVITFDDGYLDNFRVAAPYLSELGLPATFFITSGFIGSNEVASWDRDAGIPSEWMSWDQVRELHRQGFEIGAHTVTHANLGRVHHEAARREVVESVRRIEREIGSPVRLFAYPYGRREELTEENRATIKHNGLRCSLSCYGGLVHEGDGPYRLQRSPISNWYRSPSQFAWEVLR